MMMMMKKEWIGGTYQDSKGIICESWRGGGMDDVAFQARYTAGYEIVHCCQDTHDEDTFHYIFHKEDSDEPLGYCGMCRTRLTRLTAKEDFGYGCALTIHVPRGIPALYEAT